MSQITHPLRSPESRHILLNKVPEITVFFWVIKILCTTVGESAADYINETLGFGLGPTTLLMSVLLAVVLVVQFRCREYVPAVYWLTVVLISVVGTLATDNLTDGFGISLYVTTPVFAVALGAVFAIWYRVEGTLSIHSIITPRREAFYWLVVLVTFALGTAAGDLLVDQLSMSLLGAVCVYAGALALVFLAWRTRLAAPLTAFWVGYVLTRPLGGSTGDYLSGARSDGGAGLGTLATTLVFLTAIVGTVIYLAHTRRDRTTSSADLSQAYLLGAGTD
jgi:uncharacterized membrane-anchored protein